MGRKGNKSEAGNLTEKQLKYSKRQGYVIIMDFQVPKILIQDLTIRNSNRNGPCLTGQTFGKLHKHPHNNLSEKTQISITLFFIFQKTVK